MQAARTRAAAARADRLAAEELAVRDYMATLIQKSYRAFHSRRYVHDFYARQAYIARLKVKSEKMRKDLDTHRAEQLHAQALKAEEAARKEFTTVTQNFHHLVSTRSIPGVFNPPYARTAEEVRAAAAFACVLLSRLCLIVLFVVVGCRFPPRLASPWKPTCVSASSRCCAPVG